MSTFTENINRLTKLGYEVRIESYVTNSLFGIFEPSLFDPTELDTKIVVKRECVEIAIYGKEEFNKFCYDMFCHNELSGRVKADGILIEKLKEEIRNLQKQNEQLKAQIEVHKENELYLDEECIIQRQLRESEFQKNKKEYEELADKYLKLKEELMKANKLNIKLMQEKFSIWIMKNIN